MAINKVVFGSSTLIDISDTTATAGRIEVGYSAYGANGVKVNGTLVPEVNNLEVGGATVEGTAAIFDEGGGSGVIVTDETNSSGTTCVITGDNNTHIVTDYALSEAALGSDGTEDLSEAIDALTTYSNEVTGESDTTLSEAVASLAEGYGSGGFDADTLATRNYTGDVVVPNATRLCLSAFDGAPMTSFSAPKLTDANYSYVFRNCTNLISINLPKMSKIGAYGFEGCTSLRTIKLPSINALSGWCFIRCSGLETAVLYPNGSLSTESFNGCTSLTALDLGASTTSLGNNNGLKNCSSLTSIILRRSSVVALGSVNVFTGTKYASGGAGGDIYVPASLISTYKTASNWSTVNDYGTITWRSIEDSYYEDHYADGSSIS